MENNAKDKANTPHLRILKSTFIMGGSSVVTTILGIVRIKIIAMILGPSGVGLTGIYQTMISMVSSVSGMGVRESGVRQIAGAMGTGDYERISRTVISVRRTALFTGLAGLCLMFFLSGSLSQFTFGSSDRATDLALLSAAIFFAAVSGGQTALIQGMRRIGDLAKLSMLGALLGTVFSVPIIYVFGERGIPSYLLIVFGTAVLTSWWYSSKIKMPTVALDWRDFLVETKPLLKLGLALMLGSLMSPFTQYLLRVLVVRQEGLGSAGVYQASTTLSVIYVSVILNAMVTDFYPRLSAAATDLRECKSLINHQIEIGILLAVPGILAILTLAPVVITLFYSSKFLPAVDILRWQILGVVLQVVTWPMGFMLRASGDGRTFLWTELFANGMLLSFAWFGIAHFGLPGIGMAFFGMNLFYWFLIQLIIGAKYKFRLTAVNFRLLALSALATGIVFAAPDLFPRKAGLIVSSCITLAVGTYSLRTLMVKAGIDAPANLLMKMKAAFSA